MRKFIIVHRIDRDYFREFGKGITLFRENAHRYTLEEVSKGTLADILFRKNVRLIPVED